MKKIVWFLIFTLGILGILVIIYGCSQPDSTLYVCIGFILLGIPCFGIIIWAYRSTKRNAEELKKWTRYDSKYKSLYISKRGDYLRYAISMHKADYYTSHTTPTKVHYGSATVGGVTTGGVYTTGGQRVVDGSIDSGKGAIKYRNTTVKAPSEPMIDEDLNFIELSTDLAEEGQKALPQIIPESGKIVLQKRARMNKDQLQMAMNNLNSVHTQMMLKEGYMSWDDIQKIYSWLIDGTDETKK